MEGEEDWRLDPPEAGDQAIRPSAKSLLPLEVMANLANGEADLHDAYRDWLVQELIKTFPGVDLSAWRQQTRQFISLYRRNLDWRAITFILADVEESLHFNTNYLIASHVYWPHLSRDQAGEVPALLFERYRQKHGPRRKLLPASLTQGHLQIEIDYGGALLTIECTPAQYRLLERLQEAGELQPSSEDRAAITGLLLEGVICPSEAGVKMSLPNEAHQIVDAQLWRPSDNTQSKPNLDRFEAFMPFVKAMLTNLGALPLDRIHGMLGMFAPDYKESTIELGKYLTGMLDRNEIVMADGLYSLPKLS